MKYFCRNCGKTNFYQMELISYCGYCGFKFNSKNEISITNTADDIYASNKDIKLPEPDYKPKKVKPKFDLTVYKKHAVSFGELVAQQNEHTNLESNSGLNINKYQSEPSATKSADQILREFQEESSSLRKVD